LDLKEVKVVKEAKALVVTKEDKVPKVIQE